MRQPVAHGRPDVVGRGGRRPRCQLLHQALAARGGLDQHLLVLAGGPLGGYAETWSFLARRIANVMQIGQLRAASTTSSSSSAGSTPWRNGGDRGASAPGWGLAASAASAASALSVDADPRLRFKNGRSAPAVDVLIADDVVLAEVSAALHFDQAHRHGAGSPCDAGRQAARVRFDSVPASRSRRPR